MTTAICRNTAPSTPTGRPLQDNSLFSLRSIGPWQFDAGSLGITLDIGTLFRQTCDVFLFQPEGLPDLSLCYFRVINKDRKRYCNLIDASYLLNLITVETFVPFAFLEAFLSRRDCFSNLDDLHLFHSTPSIFFVLDRTRQIQCVLVQRLGVGHWSIALRPFAATCIFESCFVFVPLSLDR
jgi:hypothetical protein